ncbi:abcG22 [Symbiodinium necroappetens]|uniref:AbcG22 protein n=1 Tax=Symbiodinium necroappetens TaxID=1628268 RepID=A0A812JSU4_9DINO|nr:abcG22 [Symbiodinium necroappetens]
MSADSQKVSEVQAEKLWAGFLEQSEAGEPMRLPTFWAICEAVLRGDAWAAEFAALAEEEYRSFSNESLAAQALVLAARRIQAAQHGRQARLETAMDCSHFRRSAIESHVDLVAWQFRQNFELQSQAPCCGTTTGTVLEKGRSGQVGRQGTALEGRALTNNGLDCDETPEAYALRLRDRVAPAVAKWLASAPSAWVASFQEFPAHPQLQQEFLAVLRQTRASVQLAVGSGKTKGGAVELASYCNAVAWAGDIWTDPPQEVSVSCPGLGLVLNGADWRLSVLSFHLPFVDAPGGPRYGESLQAAKAFLRRLGGWLAGPLLAAGDFNTNVELLEDEARSAGAELALMPKSAVFRDQQLSTDGCVLLAKPGGAADVETMSQVEGVYRGSCAGLFAGMDRDAFVSKYIAQSLHEEPRLWRLSRGPGGFSCHFLPT